MNRAKKRRENSIESQIHLLLMKIIEKNFSSLRWKPQGWLGLKRKWFLKIPRWLSHCNYQKASEREKVEKIPIDEGVKTKAMKKILQSNSFENFVCAKQEKKKLIENSNSTHRRLMIKICQ